MQQELEATMKDLSTLNLMFSRLSRIFEDIFLSYSSSVAFSETAGKQNLNFQTFC